MTDWYEKGCEMLAEETAEITNVSLEDVYRVWEHFCVIGLIDYDVEKEIISERYYEGQEKTED